MSIRSLIKSMAAFAIAVSATATRAQTTWYVDDLTDPNENGTAAHPYDTIQEGINAATDGDTVLVADGTYTGPGNKTLQFYGKPITVRSANGPDTCIIDCQGAALGFYFSYSGEGNDSVVSGFTIKNGNWAGDGGGIHCTSASPTITHCVIVDNWIANSGGGIYCRNADPVISDCTITGNHANYDHGGGGIALYDSSPTITNCAIVANTTAPPGWGGGILVYGDSSPVIVNCLIAENQGTEGGGGIATYGPFTGAPTITNCTLADNTATFGDGLYINDGGTPHVANCILWDDATDEIYGTQLTVSYSDVMDADPDDLMVYSGTGNIDDNPLFVDSPTGDYHLQPGSPCIDAGDDSAVPAGVTTDLDGNPRIGCAAVDLGAYESSFGGVLINCPDDVTIQCDEPIDPSNTGEAEATDGCTGASVPVTFSDSVEAGSCANESIITRTWTGDDGAGQTASCVQIITVVDTMPPVITCPGNQIVECDGLGNTAELDAWLAGAAASDDCGSVLLVDDFVGLSDGCGATGSATVTWTATDECGNVATCSATFTIADNTPPSVDTPASDQTVECDGAGNSDDLNGWLNSHGGAVASDACGTVTWSNDFTTLSDDCGATGSATVTFTATDECDLTATTTATFTIADNTPPVLVVDTTPITVTDTDCSGDEVVTLPVATATDNCDADVEITNNAPAAFPAGETTTVTFTATDDCGNATTAQVDVTVKHGATIRVIAKKFTFGFGTRPWITREPLVGITVAAFEKSPGSCAWEQLDDNWWILWWALPDIFANCTPVTTAVTDENGLAYLDVPPGDYVVASYFDSDGDDELDMYLGRLTCGLECGEMETERLFMLHLACGRRMCGRWHRLTGSELIVVEPDEVLWDGEEQPYPFAFDSDGVWDVTVSVAPPEGFVSDYDELSEDVDNELEAVQFNITEVGSDLVPTQTRFEILHRGQRHVIESEIGIRLTPDYARQRGFDVEQLRARGLIKEKPKARAGQAQPKP